jgi:hypothetical protein
MFEDRASRGVRFTLAGISLLVLAVVCLIPIAAPIDPAKGGEQALRLFVIAVFAVSSLFGAAGLMMFIRAICAWTGRGVASRRSVAVLGVLLILLAFAVISGSYAHRPTIGLWMFLFGLITFYAGGGFLLLSVTRLPQPELSDELEG